MTNENGELSVSEAATNFLVTLAPGQEVAGQADVNRFVRWFGSQRSIAGLTPAEIENYAEQLSQSDTDFDKKLETIRALLIHAKKQKWTKTNLSTNLKVRKSKTSRPKSKARQNTPDQVLLTREGFAQMEAELADLQNERLKVIEEIRRAAADKDFRENVPFHAARERRGYIEGRIIELEATIKSAAIMDGTPDDSIHVSIGNTIILCDMATGEECRYMLVSPREVDLARGRISSASPIGQAVIGKSEGDTAVVAAPVGRLHYKIKQIE